MSTGRAGIARQFSRKWDFEGPLLKQFPAEVFEIATLDELDLYGCSVETKKIETPPQIGKLKALRKLAIGMARVEALPEALGALTKLVELNLCSAEQLRSLPASLGKLRALQRLELQ